MNKMGKPVTILVAAALAWTLGSAGPATAREEAAVVRTAALGTLTVAGRIDRLIDRVVDLHEVHGLRWSDTGGLIAVLEEALIVLQDGRCADIARQLGGFRDRVAAHLAQGRLEPGAAAPVLAANDDLIHRVDALCKAEPAAAEN